MAQHVRTERSGRSGTWLVGLLAGIGLAWFFRAELFGIFDSSADITLKPVGDDGAGIDDQTHYVAVKKNHHLTWTVRNDSKIPVTVSIQDWSDGAGSERTPAVDPDPDSDDEDEPAQEPQYLRRTVPPGKKRKIRGRARPPANGEREYVYYVTYLNGKPGKDPIVKLVL